MELLTSPEISRAARSRRRDMRYDSPYFHVPLCTCRRHLSLSMPCESQTPLRISHSSNVWRSGHSSGGDLTSATCQKFLSSSWIATPSVAHPFVPAPSGRTFTSTRTFSASGASATANGEVPSVCSVRESASNVHESGFISQPAADNANAEANIMKAAVFSMAALSHTRA